MQQRDVSTNTCLPGGIRTPGQFVRMEFGDLTQDDIKQFVYGGKDNWPGMLELVKTTSTNQKAREGFTLPGSMWDAAYQLLGGNIGNWQVAISQAASDFAAHDRQHLEASWERGQ